MNLSDRILVYRQGAWWRNSRRRSRRRARSCMRRCTSPLNQRTSGSRPSRYGHRRPGRSSATDRRWCRDAKRRRRQGRPPPHRPRPAGRIMLIVHPEIDQRGGRRTRRPSPAGTVVQHGRRQVDVERYIPLAHGDDGKGQAQGATAPSTRRRAPVADAPADASPRNSLQQLIEGVIVELRIMRQIAAAADDDAGSCGSRISGEAPRRYRKSRAAGAQDDLVAAEGSLRSAARRLRPGTPTDAPPWLPPAPLRRSSPILQNRPGRTAPAARSTPSPLPVARA